MISENSASTSFWLRKAFFTLSTLQYILLAANILSIVIFWQRGLVSYDPNSGLHWEATKYFSVFWLFYPILAYLTQAFQLVAYRKADTPKLPLYERASLKAPNLGGLLSLASIVFDKWTFGQIWPLVALLGLFQVVVQAHATTVTMKMPTKNRVMFYYVPTLLVCALSGLGTVAILFLMAYC
jgi:hypothetical protein